MPPPTKTRRSRSGSGPGRRPIRTSLSTSDWNGGARWRDDLVPVATIVIAERDGVMIGFVTIERQTGYLDQLVVAPEFWRSGIGRMLVDEAKRLSPEKIELHVNQDNERAIALYTKTGFSITGESVSKHSGLPLYVMTWRPK